MAELNASQRADADKAERQAARALVASYHQEELRKLLDHVRIGFVRLDAGEIDEFELDELIHRYKRAAAKLWSFCGSSGGGWQQAANALKYLGDRRSTARLVDRGGPATSVTRASGLAAYRYAMTYPRPYPPTYPRRG